jgi:hypothetical protein
MQHVLAKTWGQEKHGQASTSQSTIENNENLLNYLRLLVEYVNSNLAIMNGKDFAGRSSEAAGRVERSDLAMKLCIPMIKEPKGASASFYDYSMLKCHVDNSFSGQSRSRPASNMMTMSFGGPTYRSPFSGINVGMGFSVPYQSGGVVDIYSYQRKIGDGNISGPEALYGIIRTTIEEIRADHGKTIDEGDIQEITKKVDGMKAYEQELIKTEKYLEEFKYLLGLFKDYKSEILTLKNIEQIVEKKKDLLSRQFNSESDLVKILGSLQGLKSGNCEDFVNDDCNYEKAVIDTSLLPMQQQKNADCVPAKRTCC